MDEIGPIDAGRDDTDQHLTRSWIGLGDVNDIQGFDPSGSGYDDSAHPRTVPILGDSSRFAPYAEPPEKMDTMRVALVQLASVTDATTNRGEIAARLAEFTGSDEVDLVVLPEAAMADFGPADLDLGALAEPLDGPFVQLLRGEARRLGTTIVAGMFEATDQGRPFNTLVVVGPDGTLLTTYRKIHLYDSFGYRESDRLSPGTIEPVIVEIAGRSVGLMTCYDLRFPEHGRALAIAGADLLVVPAAWVAGEHKVDQWRILLAARAIENTLQVVAAAKCGTGYSGHSMALDPWGDAVAEAGDDPATVVVELSEDDVSRARAANPSLANRRIGV